MNGKFFNQGNMGNNNDMNNYNSNMQPDMNSYNNQGMNNQFNNMNQPINNDYNQMNNFNNQGFNQGMNQNMGGFNPQMQQPMVNNNFNQMNNQPMMNDNQFNQMNNQYGQQPMMNNQFNQQTGPEIGQPMMGNQQPVKNYKFFGFDQLPNEQPEALDMNNNNPNQQMSNLGVFSQYANDSMNQTNMVGGYGSQPDMNSFNNQPMMNNNQPDMNNFGSMQQPMMNNQSMNQNMGGFNPQMQQPIANNNFNQMPETNNFNNQPMMNNNQSDMNNFGGMQQPMMNDNQFDRQNPNNFFEPNNQPPVNNQPVVNNDFTGNSVFDQPVKAPKEKFQIDFKSIFRDKRKIAIIVGASAVLIILITIALATGGSKTLTCVKEEKLGSITESETYIVKFKKNNIKDYKYTQVLTLETEEDAKNEASKLEVSTKEADGLYKSYNIKQTGKKVTLRASMDIDKLTEDDPHSYKELKEGLEKLDFSCE